MISPEHADFAELIPTDNPSKLGPGDVLILDLENPFAVMKSNEPNSQLIAGVYSTKPAILVGGNLSSNDSLESEIPLAIAGIVPTKVTSERGPIKIGDLLTSSSTEGYAMKSEPAVINNTKIYSAGTILGKALEPMENKTVVIKVLIMLK